MAAADGDRRRGLNHKPAWQTQGIGINEKIFGETRGDLMKPGLTKADLERLENAKPEGPDPFGDVFRETGVAATDMDVDEADPDYDPFSELPAEENPGAGSSANTTSGPPPPKGPSMTHVKAPSKAAAFGPPGPPPGPMPHNMRGPPGPPDSAPSNSKSAQTKSARHTQTSKAGQTDSGVASKSSSQAKSSSLTKSAGAMRMSGCVAKSEQPSVPAKMPPAGPPGSLTADLLDALPLPPGPSGMAPGPELLLPPDMFNLIAPGMPILPPLPPAAAVAAGGLFPADVSAASLGAPIDMSMFSPGSISDISSIPLPGLLPPSFLPAAAPMPIVPAPVNLDPSKIVHWETHMSPQGAPYYYCQKTRESRWVMPMGPYDIVADFAPAAPAEPAKPDVKTQLGEVESTETIGRTGWMRVETENGYKYFFHKKKKITSWECPAEIAKEVAELDGVLGFTPDASEPAKEEAGEAAVDASEPKAAEEAKPAAPVELTPEQIAEKKKKEEQVSKEKQRLLNFKQLLIEKGVKAFDKFEKWLPKLLHEPRFTAIPGQKERKALFDALAKRIDVDRKKLLTEQKRSNREVFKELIEKAENTNMFKEDSAEAVIKAMAKRFDTDKRWESLPEAERNRKITEAWEEFDRKRKKVQEQAKVAFRELVLTFLKGKEDRPPKFMDIKRKLREDKRWDDMESTAECEKIYHQVVGELDVVRKKKMKRQRQDAQEIENARKQRKLSEAEEELMNFLTERVKQPFSLEWEDVLQSYHRNLRKISLSPAEQEKVWKEYRQQVGEARCSVFLQHLNDIPADVIGPDMSFDAVLEKAKDPAFEGMPEDLMRSCYEDWRVQAYERAVELCKQWLRSCEHFRGSEEVDPAGGPAFEDLLKRFKDDPRYKRLSAKPEVQRQLVAERLKELRELKAQRVALEDDEA